ncbi:HalOD1 output domain-containing protein [Halorientalis brevis]|uniref:HalOD1 output domain-containing protein n=1 Tax=Halorientalis brevis TaxID=1126241 RepID=A0ABD6C5X8_9EURY|nr:HalOD1 output domain-containing protein [Halorientalis brevis]
MTGIDVVTDGDDQCRTVVGESEAVSEAVVRLVATVDETDPLELPPLARVLDPDAVDAVFEPAPGRAGTASRTLTFSYAGYTVTVDGTESEQVCLIRES